MVLRNLSRKQRAAFVDIGIRGGPSTRIRRGLPANGTREVATSLTLDHPRLWQPGHPSLYSMRVGASLDDHRRAGRRVSTYALAFGVKKLERRGLGGPAQRA